MKMGELNIKKTKAKKNRLCLYCVFFLLRYSLNEPNEDD